MMPVFRSVLLLFFSLEFSVFCRRSPWERVPSGNRIIGGDPLSIEEAPYQAQLIRRNGKLFCGAIIINARTVVTAAHCIRHAKLGKVKVRTSTADSDKGGLMYECTDFRIHPLYDRNEGFSYDVGVVKLAEDMVLDGVKAEAVKLAESGIEIKPGTPILVSGWGYTVEGSGALSHKLMGAKVFVVSEKECKDAFDNIGIEITPSILCAADVGKDHCHGDSGGPGVSLETGELVGVVSFGNGCARPGYPGAYAKISDPIVHNFILENF